jgi:ribosomal protein S18 acetylase RimI-like enzyme
MIRRLKIDDQTELDAHLLLVTEAQRVQHVEIDGRDTQAQSDVSARETWLANLTDAHTTYFVYEDDGKLKGYILVRDNGDHSATIEDLGVGRHFQRQGIGGKLVEYLIEWAPLSGFTSIQLVTQFENFAAVATYRKAGFDESTGDYIDFKKRL